MISDQTEPLDIFEKLFIYAMIAIAGGLAFVGCYALVSYLLFLFQGF